MVLLQVKEITDDGIKDNSVFVFSVRVWFSDQSVFIGQRKVEVKMSGYNDKLTGADIEGFVNSLNKGMSDLGMVGDFVKNVNYEKLSDKLIDEKDFEEDKINHPKHYTNHPSGVECIQITEHMNFNLGNALKYIWRSDLKNGVEDLKKAAWYIQREIERRSK